MREAIYKKEIVFGCDKKLSHSFELSNALGMNKMKKIVLTFELE